MMQIIPLAQEQLYEHCHTSNKNAFFGGATWYTQTFTPEIAHEITRVRLMLGKSAAYCGDITVSIRATENRLPIGEDLISATFDSSSLPYSPQWCDFPLTPYQLEAGRMYAIVMRANSLGVSCPISDSILGNPDYPYSKGSFCLSGDHGATWEDTGPVLASLNQAVFEEWGLPPPPTPIEQINTTIGQFMPLIVFGIFLVLIAGLIVRLIRK